MSGIGIYNQMRSWSAKLKAQNAKALSNTAALADQLASNVMASTDSQIGLLTQIIATRAKREAAAKQAAALKQAKQQNSYEKVMQGYAASQRSRPTELASGGRLNLEAGTLSLSDGSSIDLKTGYKVPENISKNFLVLSDGTRIDRKTGLRVVDIVS